MGGRTVSELIRLASELVRLPSVNPPGRESLVASLLLPYLTDAGLAVDQVDVLPGRPTLLATLPGAGIAPAQIFTGHLDVVPISNAERARWASDPFSGDVRDGRLWGRGAADMKGGLAALVRAAVELREEGRTPPGDVVLVLTSDEEDLMSGSKAVAAHPLLDRDADLVVCEPTSLRPCTVGRGRTWARVTVAGRTGHGSHPGSPNAIELALALLNAVATEDFSDTSDADHGLSFWRPLAIQAGVEPCVVPDTCTFTLDARLVPDHDPDDVWRRLDAHVAALRSRVPGVDVTVEVVDRREGWRTAASPLVRDARRALDEEDVPGPRPLDLCFAGTTDGTVLRRAGAHHGVRDTIVLGPGELAAAHRESEWVSVDELDAARRVYRRLMLRYEEAG